MKYADTVIKNGKIATVDKNFSFAESLAILNGWIIDIGTNEQMRKYIGPDTTVTDLNGRTVLPGIHDSHCHLTEHVDTTKCIDCSRERVSSLSDLGAVLKESIENYRPGQIVRGRGFDENMIRECRERGSLLNCRDLDAISDTVPIVIESYTGHSGFANTAAIRLAGITNDTPDPLGGKFGRDADGQLNGQFHDHSAIIALYSKFPRLSVDTIKEYIIEGQKELNALGYTSICDAIVGPGFNNRGMGADGDNALKAFVELADENKLTMRVSMGFLFGKNGHQSYDLLVDDLENYPFPELKNKRWLDMHMIKMFADGVHVDHTAWMKNDYLDAPGNHGHSVWLTPDRPDEEQAAEMARCIKLVHDKGYQVGIHTIGDKAVKLAIDAIIDAIRENPGKSRRHYVIHGDSLGDPEDYKECAKYDIGNAVQSNLMEFLFVPTEMCCGKEKADRFMAHKDLTEMGVWITNGSDTAGSFKWDPWQHAMQMAVTRRCGETGVVHRPDLASSVEDIVREFTYNGAYQEWREDISGSLEPGKLADLIVLDQDIFTVDPYAIGKTQVLLTMIEGKVVYEK